jgi:hypothetical protein
MERQVKKETQQEGAHEKANPQVHSLEGKDENDGKNNTNL